MWASPPAHSLDIEALRSWRTAESVHLPFAFSPISTNRRMASERETSCATAQASRAATVPSSKRAGIVSPNLTPAGRPLDFLCTVFDCLVMIIRVHEKRSFRKDCPRRGFYPNARIRQRRSPGRAAFLSHVASLQPLNLTYQSARNRRCAWLNLRRPLGKSRTASWNCAFRVDSSKPRLIIVGRVHQ
jgi:hypothetical protein